MTKSALEELVAAASAGAPDCGCGCPVEPGTMPGCGCTTCTASRKLAALAPDMARAGQALADELRKRSSILHYKLGHGDAGFWQHCPEEPCAADREALATWKALGEAKEGR